ncbi:hypothetical protein K435DRAFT_678257, partial [Dendrothele bispora CBS 962.96]
MVSETIIEDNDREFASLLAESQDYVSFLSVLSQEETSDSVVSDASLAREPEKASHTTKEVFLSESNPRSNRNERRRLLFDVDHEVKKRSYKASRIIPRKSTRKQSIASISKDSFTLEDTKVEKIQKARSLPEGLSSLGTKALCVKARLGSLDSQEMEVRLDSGADITLISENTWKELDLPTPKSGLRMKLYQLTGEAKVLGYVQFPVYINSTDGTTLCFDTEAYVVRNMNAPILLGEDFQTMYELAIIRNSSGKHVLMIGKSPKTISASSVKGNSLNFEIRKAEVSQAFVKTKARRRARARMRTKPHLPPEVFSIEDVVIQPGTVHNVKIDGPFEGRTDWLVEKLIIGTQETSILAAPSTFIDSSNPTLPIANPSTRPWMIKTGDV